MKKWISKNIFHSSNLIKAFKKEKRKKLYFDLKPISKNKNQNFKFIIWFQIKKWISKSSFIFQFCLWNWKMKNEKFLKFVLFLNLKTNYTFVSVHGLRQFFVFNFNLKNEKPKLLKQISYKTIVYRNTWSGK